MDERKKSAWAVITNSNEEYLLLKRGKNSNNPGLWNFPGGTVDPGENTLLTAKRELKEEAGINTSNLSFARVILSDRVNMFFYARQLTKEIKVKINNESDEYRWLNKAAIKKLKLHPPTKAFFGF